MSRDIIYPFTAIVAQEQMKQALILNMIYPQIGGVLIKGEKGTAKSTAVRGLSDVMPERRENEGCLYHCLPEAYSYWCDDCKERQNQDSRMSKLQVVTLPIGASEDRVIGTIDIEKAIKKGEKHFEPGILAYANNGVLYVDEINLLDDHLVDLLLDCAAMGVNTVEREGISFKHPAKFTLIGTMNPEEGDLRPQLLDRFGLMVTVESERDVDLRTEVVKRRIAFENDPEEFCRQYESQQKALGEKIHEARNRLKDVQYSDNILETIARLAIGLGVDGHRADITMLKTARAQAAFEGRNTVEQKDIVLAASLCLPHRMRKLPFDDMVFDIERIQKIIEGKYDGNSVSL